MGTMTDFNNVLTDPVSNIKSVWGLHRRCPIKASLTV